MPTTVPATTEQVTTSSSYNNVVPVVGYGYSYGKKLLEQAGFTVEISDYEYSYDYPEGYIISQTPEGDTSASAGTVVKLVISSGQILLFVSIKFNILLKFTEFKCKVIKQYKH